MSEVTVTMIVCCRCGGGARVNEYGNGVCMAGIRSQTCGWWWRRSGSCTAEWYGPFKPDKPAGACAWCGNDHGLFFTPTHTTPTGAEHVYHSPASSQHRVVAVVRPRLALRPRRLSQLRVSAPIDSGLLDTTKQRQLVERVKVMYQLAA